MFGKRSSFSWLLPLAALLAAAPAYAAPTVSIAPGGGGSFVIGGAGFENAATVDLQISYDSAAFRNPRVSGGRLAANGFTAANTTAAGTIFLSIVGNGPMKGSGPLATITFDRTGTAAVAGTSVTGSIIGADGKTVRVASAAQQPAQQPGEGTQSAGTGQSLSSSGSSSDRQQTVNSDAGSATGTVVLGGSVSLPGDPFRKSDNAEEKASQREPREQVAEVRREQNAEPKEAAPPAESAAQEAAAAKAQTVAVTVPQSALERFRLFSGARSQESLLALLKPPQDLPLVQEPAVAIADGKGTVKVTVQLAGDKAPSFAVNAARTVSVSAGEGGWQLELQPAVGALKASVMVLSGSSVLELPVTVAPAAEVDLDRSGRVTEADFALFLKERGTPAAPRFDLNGDGRRDYLDDYIFAANYLAAAAKQGARREEPAGKSVAMAQGKEGAKEGSVAEPVAR